LGTKLRISSPGHVPSQQALGIGKISLCDLEARD
jgi:hypothetical protein